MPYQHPGRRGVALLLLGFAIPIGLDVSRNLLGLLSSDTSGSEFSWNKILPSKKLSWTNCFSNRQCARLIVPLNHSDPEGLEAVIAMIRIPSHFSSDSEFYKGPILFNPGGPGDSGVDFIQGSKGDFLSKIVGPAFDVVGFDPRGVARSTPRASFFKTRAERELWKASGSGMIVNNTAEGIARTWARSRVMGQLAGETDTGYLRHINTDQTARDMLRIVEAHGRSKIQYWGFSYGSVLGATFAAMFPDKVERLIIDGVVDSEDYYKTLWLHNLFDTDKAMDSFFTGCSEAGPDSCPFWAPTAENIRQNLTNLYESIRSRPLPVKTESSYGLLDYSMLRVLVFSSLYTPYGIFPPLAQGLAELAAGNGTALFQLSKRLGPPPFQCSCDPTEGMFEAVDDALPAISCNDGDDVPEDINSTQEYFDKLMKMSQWGETWARVRMNCIGWPKFAKNHFQGPFEAKTSHPMLIIGNTADPVTPLWAAKKMSTGFDGSVVLTQNSAGHCSTAAPSLCTQKYVRAYFMEGTLPAPGTVCETDEEPFLRSKWSNSRKNQVNFTSVLNDAETEMLFAISELSKLSPGISAPFFRGSTLQSTDWKRCSPRV